ncbi:hypothetical protein ACPCG0_11235 [Propionibacteriaceae bacterium Y1923]|uniref:hypothetical protein n=1 Tax=Aestuariimicrobium sp. Y1814 TaxID=3418742 RepID=UPI003C25CDA6
MAVVLLCSISGAPGTTTTALGLSLQWPRPVVLADCDRDAPQAITGGYLGGQGDGRGLTTLMQAARLHSSIRGGLLEHTQRLDLDGRRLFLPGFRHPSASAIFSSWAQVAEEFSDLHHRGMDVLVDAGRVGPAGLPTELVRRADQVLVVTRSTLRCLVALSAHLPTLLDQVESLSAACEVGLAVVGPGRPYSNAEVSAQFGVPVALSVDWAPDHAAVLSDAADPPRRFDTSAYLTSLVKAAHGLQRRLGTRLAHRDPVAPLAVHPLTTHGSTR